MHPACQICRGACCEAIMLPPCRDPEDTRWLALHGREVDGRVELLCQCHHLLPDGSCGCYEDRPRTCRVYEVGGVACLRAVRRRRTPAVLEEVKRLVGL